MSAPSLGIEEIRAALRTDPRVLEACEAWSSLTLIAGVAEAKRVEAADVQNPPAVGLFLASVLLARARRGQLGEEAWEAALALVGEDAVGGQVARAVAAAAFRGGRAAALADVADGVPALWAALAGECPRIDAYGGRVDDATAALAARGLAHCARYGGSPAAALSEAARWLETGACSRAAGGGPEKAGTSPLALFGGALARAAGAALAGGDAFAARAACDLVEAACERGAVRSGDDAVIDALAAAAGGGGALTRPAARACAALAKADGVRVGAAETPAAAALLGAVAAGCGSTDAAAAEACCAAWVRLLQCGGGARRVQERRPALYEAAVRATPVLVGRAVHPRGGVAPASFGADADGGDEDGDPALCGDDEAPLPGGAGSWDEGFDVDSWRRTRDGYLAEGLRSSADALGPRTYSAAVADAVARLGPGEPDVLAAAARAFRWAAPQLARAAADDGGATADFLRGLLAACARAAVDVRGPRSRRLAAATSQLIGAVARWLCADEAALRLSLAFLGEAAAFSAAACSAARTVLTRAYSPAVARKCKGHIPLVDASLPALAAAAELDSAVDDVSRASLFRGLGTAALFIRDGCDDAARAATLASLAGPPLARLAAAAAAGGADRDWRAVAALAREAARNGSTRAEAAVATGAVAALRSAWARRDFEVGEDEDKEDALEACGAALASATTPTIVLATLEAIVAAARADAPTLRLVADVVERRVPASPFFFKASRARDSLLCPPPSRDHSRRATLAGRSASRRRTGLGASRRWGARCEDALLFGKREDAAPLARGLQTALPAALAAADVGDDAAHHAVLVLASRAVCMCPVLLLDGDALPRCLAAAAAGATAHREKVRVAAAACDFAAALGAFAAAAAPETMAGEDVWRDPDAPKGETALAAERRRRVGPALSAALAASGAALVEAVLAPVLEATPPHLDRDRANALLGLHALDPDGVARRVADLATRLRPDLQTELCEAVRNARTAGRGATGPLLAVFAKAH